MAPRLLVAFGERRERFPDAASFEKYVGIAPVTERSGNQSWVHWRWAFKWIRILWRCLRSASGRELGGLAHSVRGQASLLLAVRSRPQRPRHGSTHHKKIQRWNRGIGCMHPHCLIGQPLFRNYHKHSVHTLF